MKNILILICIAILFVGCGRDLPVNGEEVLMINDTRLFSRNRTISAKAPNNLKIPFVGYYRFDKELLNFERTIPSMMKEVINIRVWDLRENFIENRLLSQETNKEFEEYLSSLPLSKWKISNHLDTGINYYKEYTDFISGLKCATSVYSRNIANGIGSKGYGTSCPYYDKQGTAKQLNMGYHFYYTFNQTTFEGDDTPSLKKHRFEEMQLQFKKDMKEIFDSLQIHNMDKERMKKEGLLYGKKYALDTEAKAKDKSMKCTFIKQTDSFRCIGRETSRTCTKKRTETYDKWKCKEQ